MDNQGLQYAGLGPPDPLAHMPDGLSDVNFDAPEFPEQIPSFLESLDPPPSSHAALLEEFSDLHPEPAPTAAEPEDKPAAQYIDPRMLNHDSSIADFAFQQDSQNAKPPVNNGGNVFTPMGYVPAPPSYPLNAVQYHYSQQTNGPYLGHGAMHGAVHATTHPIQGLPYPLQGPSYAVHGPSHHAQPLVYPPLEGTTYQLPKGLYPMPMIAHPATLTMPPVPEAFQQPLQPFRDPNRISFDSSGYPKRRSGRRSKIPSPELIWEERLRRPSKGSNGEALKNDRIPRVTRRNQEKPNPRDWYGDPLPKPDSWGPEDKNGRRLFRYTDCGELERGRVYSVKEMRWYLYGPKKTEEQFEFPKKPKTFPEVRGKVRQGLTIWVGWVAPQSNERYPFGPQSHRCRFADCPEPNNTIRTGFPRVIFDERHNVDGDAVDPFHNAGYAHLYCFERHFDLVQTMIHLDVRMDHRHFKREENLGKLSRNFPEIQSEVEDWWRDEFPAFQRLGKSRDRSYEHTLSYRIVCHSLEHASQGRIKMREMRGGADMSKHKGNLELQKFLKDCIRHGLIDDNGDPIPNAKNELVEIWSGKTKRRPGTQRIHTDEDGVPAEAYTEHQPGDAYGAGNGRYLTPQLSPVAHIPGHRGMSRPLSSHYSARFSPDAQTDCNQTLAGAPLYQQRTPPVSPRNPPQKRKMDDMLAEDRTINLTQENAQGLKQEPPAAKQRLEPTTNVDSAAPITEHAGQQPQFNGEQVGNGEYIKTDTLLDEIAWDQEARDTIGLELNDSAIFDLIDKEIPGGKSSPAKDGVDWTTEPWTNREESEPMDWKPSPARSLERELNEGDDLFGDVALETHFLDVKVKVEPMDD
ncbi:hypothetical protein F5Y05DRAFT_407161 [Hypoxylon sp. FL0543]|nr:hypothetical protein F5Y05DRAFT_407161 [Hypoxylon sp. FL0543]